MDWLGTYICEKNHSHYPDTLLYRFLNSFRFDLEVTYNGIKNHEEWLNNPSTF